MKNFKKALFTLSLFTIVAFISCSKTIDGLGLDTINNSVRTGKWESVVRQTYIGAATNPATNTELTPGTAYAEFKSDNKVHFYNESGVENPSIATTYSFLDTKSILYGGNEYDIQENLAGTFSKMTLQRTTPTGREVYIFQR